MPSLFRFLAVLGLICGATIGALYAVAVLLEPPQKEMSAPVPGIKARR